MSLTSVGRCEFFCLRPSSPVLYFKFPGASILVVQADGYKTLLLAVDLSLGAPKATALSQ